MFGSLSFLRGCLLFQFAIQRRTSCSEQFGGDLSVSVRLLQRT